MISGNIKSLAKVKKITIALTLASLTMIGYSASSTAAEEMVGVNFGSGAFGHGRPLPGLYNRDFTYASENYFKEWNDRGVKLIRFPILWERLQPKPHQNLDSEQVRLLVQSLNYAKKYNQKIIIDIHNYGRYYDKIIGQGTTYEAYGDFLKRLVYELKDHQAIYGWDIMNEPHDMPTGYWDKAAQVGIDAVRTHDKKRYIFIEGNSWASAKRWPQYSDNLKNLKDPSNNLVFSAHQYFDQHESGKYNPEDMSKVYPNIGIDKVKPFVEWLKKNNLKGYIGEYGVPPHDPKWLVAMDNMLKYLADNCIPSTIWAAGPWWGNNILAVEPINGQERPQWGVVKKHVHKTCNDIGPGTSGGQVGNPAPTPAPIVTAPAAPTTPVTKPNAGGELITTDTVTLNNFTSNVWLKGVFRNADGFSVRNNPANLAALKSGTTIKFADGSVRKVTRIQVVGQHLSVFVTGGRLDGNKVGYPNKISIVKTTGDSGNDSNAGNNSGGNNNNAVTTPNVSSGSVTLNNFTSNVWNKGVFRNNVGFSVKNTPANVATLKAGVDLKFADGSVRKITRVQVVGQHLSIFVTGSRLDGNKVGYPNKISIVNGNGNSNTDSGNTTGGNTNNEGTTGGNTDSGSGSNGNTVVKTSFNNYTNTHWLNGVFRTAPGFSIANNSTNLNAFKVGNYVQFANKDTRKITKVQVIDGRNLSIFVDGARLDGSKVGHPNTINVLTSQ